MTVPSWWTREIGPGDSGHDVEIVRRILGAPRGLCFDDHDAVEIRGRQYRAGLPVTGVVDAETARLLGERADYGQPPRWFTRELELGMVGDDVHAARELLEIPGAYFSRSTENAVRRYQSAHGLPLTGVVDEAMAIMLGE